MVMDICGRLWLADDVRLLWFPWHPPCGSGTTALAVWTHSLPCWVWGQPPFSPVGVMQVCFNVQVSLSLPAVYVVSTGIYLEGYVFKKAGALINTSIRRDTYCLEAVLMQWCPTIWRLWILTAWPVSPPFLADEFSHFWRSAFGGRVR